jgi:hypothetical protein
LCVFNARSVKNKNADIVDYICVCKADLVVVTKTWLCLDYDAVRVELCPDGYKFIDHCRVGQRREGTGLLFRDFFNVRKIEACANVSFEFSEWLVRADHQSLRIVIINRPPRSNISINTFYTEFLLRISLICALFSRFRTAFDGRRSTQAWLQNLTPFQVFINTSIIQDKTLTIYINFGKFKLEKAPNFVNRPASNVDSRTPFGSE